MSKPINIETNQPLPLIAQQSHHTGISQGRILPIQDAPESECFDILPPEVWIIILEHGLQFKNSDESKQFLYTGRQVCKSWRGLIDEKILPMIWSKVTNIPYIGEFSLIQRRFNEEKVTTPESLPLPLREFKSLSKAIESPTFLLSPLEYEQHIDQINTTLVKIWNSSQALQNGLASRPITSASIHSFLKSAESSLLLRSIVCLNLSDYDLSFLPPEIALFFALTELNLQANRFSEIPALVGKLSQLQILNLQGNRIAKISDGIDQCSRLTELNLQANQLSEIPGSVLNLSQLKTLNLQGNRITKIPDGIDKCIQLMSLDLENNKVTQISPDIGKLAILCRLYLRKNQIASVPETLKNVSCLQYVDLDNNRIETVSDIITELYRNKVSICLTNNPVDENELKKLYLSRAEAGFLDGVGTVCNFFTSSLLGRGIALGTGAIICGIVFTRVFKAQ